jgi:hypothetical protein
MGREEGEVMSASHAGERSSDEIRRDIERTRSEMDETVDALEQRLSPGQMLDEAWHLLKSQGGGAGDVVRDHPVPLALMGLGVAWLAIEKATGSSASTDGDVGPGTYARAEGRVGPYLGDAVSRSDEPGRSDRAAAAAVHAKDEAKARLGEAGEWVKDHLPDGNDATELKERAGQTARRAASSVKHGAHDAKRGLGSLFDDQPLALGAIAFGLGIAAGAAVPTTRWEDEHIGPAAETLKDEVKAAAKDAGRTARAAAGDALDAARAEADRQDIRSNLGEAAKRVAAEAKLAARERAEREDLTGDGLTERAREIGRATRDGASDEMR